MTVWIRKHEVRMRTQKRKVERRRVRDNIKLTTENRIEAMERS